MRVTPAVASASAAMSPAEEADAERAIGLRSFEEPWVEPTAEGRREVFGEPLLPLLEASWLPPVGLGGFSQLEMPEEAL